MNARSLARLTPVLAAALVMSTTGLSRAQVMPESVLINVDQRYEFRKPSLMEYDEIEGHELPVVEHIEDMLFAADIEPLLPGDGDAESTIQVEVRGQAIGGIYLEPGRAYLYTGANLAGEITIVATDGSVAARSFAATIQRPFDITLNLGYDDPANAPFRIALEQPGGFLEQICHAMAEAWGVESIMPSLHEDEPAIRYAVAAALGNIGDPIAVPDLIEALHDDHERVRWEAAWSLGRIGDVSAIPELIEALNDDSGDVRWFSSWSLRALTGEDFGSDYDAWIGWLETSEATARG
ncbi:MAG: HEAT repeat domain-containing protein [Rhodospirillales bacterium]|nr:HEAT repeat domain-containing protein [Rhodospirillales bacterium]